MLNLSLVLFKILFEVGYLPLWMSFPLKFCYKSVNLFQIIKEK